MFLLVLTGMVDESSSQQTVPERPFKCSKCGWGFKRNDNLMHHTKFVCDGMNEPRFSCSKCGSRFKMLAHLQRHLIAVHKIDHSQLALFGAGKLLRINIT